MVSEKNVNVRVPEGEFLLLERYARATGRTKTDVVRALIRGLEPPAREAKAKARAKSAG